MQPIPSTNGHHITNQYTVDDEPAKHLINIFESENPEKLANVKLQIYNFTFAKFQGYDDDEDADLDANDHGHDDYDDNPQLFDYKIDADEAKSAE